MNQTYKIEEEIITTDISIIFDEGCSMWSSIPEYNELFLRCQQNYFNDLLTARGHVFLNEVLDGLDLPRTKAGAVTGWINKDGATISFNPEVDGLITKLTFNVQGVIYNLI